MPQGKEHILGGDVLHHNAFYLRGEMLLSSADVTRGDINDRVEVRCCKRR